MTAAEELLGRAREDPDLVLLEGFHALKHALRFGAELVSADTVDPEGVARLAAELAPDLELGGRLVPVDGLGAHAHHTGVLAVARRPAFDVERLGAGPIVLLEHPRHPGNLGAVVRVAAAAGAAAVLTTGGRDPWDAAALRGSAGLHFALPVARVAGPSAGRPLVAGDPGGQPLDALPDRSVLAFGSERHGLGPELLARADARVGIPMREGVSSLNLATAVAVVLYSSAYPSPSASP